MCCLPQRRAWARKNSRFKHPLQKSPGPFSKERPRAFFMRLKHGYLERAHVIALAHFDTIVTQQCVGGGDVEEELRQAVGQQVSLASEAFLFRRALTGDDLDPFLAIDLLRLELADEGQNLSDQRLQFGEGGFG